jgi:hypothetical protein
MSAKTQAIESLLETMPTDRQQAMKALRTCIKKKLPNGFEEGIQYGMISYYVPHSLYPKGYHCDPKQPLPFLSIASQKNFIAVYHMGLYADPTLLEWFTKAYAQANVGKLDMGKSCIRFKKPDQMPLALLGELFSKMSPKQWIARYESAFKK